MTKIVYPEEGINTLVIGTHRNATDFLNSAYNLSSFDLPSSLNYTYRTYLYNLDDKLKQYKREMSSIGSNISTVSTKMDSFADEIYRDVKNKLKDKKVTERERLIR